MSPGGDTDSMSRERKSLNLPTRVMVRCRPDNHRDKLREAISQFSTTANLFVDTKKVFKNTQVNQTPKSFMQYFVPS